MIIVRIHFGLGNQLFQYALGRSISLQKGVEFSLDTSYFLRSPNSEHPRIYQLNHFNIVENIASIDKVNTYLKPVGLKKKWRDALYTVLPYYKRSMIYEMKRSYDKNILRIKKNNVYLHGFWQDERFFSAIEDNLRKDLTFKTKPSDSDIDVLEKISTTNAVSIHIRRGDYLTDQYVIKYIGMCDLQYYYKAVEAISRLVDNCVFYIFSDDATWVKENFKIRFPSVIVNHNSQENSFQDLRLMSNCKYHIISNSTFSWWSAWLAQNRDKIVIAPKVWRSKGPNMFMPDGWISL